MKILTECNLAELVVDLLSGKTIVFPTETSYGLGCDATNQAAVDKIFKIKGRKSDKPLLVVVPTVEMARKYLAWSDLLGTLAKKYWPGPLTVVGLYVPPLFKEGIEGWSRTNGKRLLGFIRTIGMRSELRKNKTKAEKLCEIYNTATTARPHPTLHLKGEETLADGVVSSEGTVAIRVTANPLLKSITEKLGKPLVATSANVADGGDSYSAESVIAQFQNRAVQPDIILDYGELPKRPPTTIVSVIGGKFKVFRQGEQEVSV
ncbi:MAG: Sua5/YciO/YrdC/YwlC family protein [Candidatus Magasanikbacteria bacterium]|nr:Sua5/YciO/YrdC/YwlC family protein [Candidatus Magasanikbacteria bacterium]